jgi:uncharacterized membrane protein
MKSIILLSIYLLSFVIIYMMLSLVGLIFSCSSYVEILHSQTWGAIYCVFFGWWMATFPAREYYAQNEDYFMRVF